MCTVFICYSRNDLPEARTFHEALVAAGLNCWRDERWLNPGDDFAAEITKAIRGADVFLLLLSPESNCSDYVHKETAIAHHFRKPIVPVLLRNVELSDALAPYVVRLHFWDHQQKGSAAEFAEALAIKISSPLEKNSQPTTQRSHGSDQQADLPRPEATHLTTGDTYLVTRSDFFAFIQNSGSRTAAYWREINPRSASDDFGAPVTGISWDEAVAYCDWMGGRLPDQGISVAARGPEFGPPTVGDVHPFSEWYDAGTERHKQVRDARTFDLTALMDRGSRESWIGFRCVPLTPLPSRVEWASISGGLCSVGTDIAQFTRITSRHRIPPRLAQPILDRAVERQRVSSFKISTICVTNEDFYPFTKSTGRQWPPHWDSRWLRRFDRPFPRSLAARPVVNVSAEDARAYCVWSRTRLSTWAEWERAASGPVRQAYPWGTDYDPTRCNSIESERGGLTQVDDYRSGVSVEGLYQLSGNVEEWVQAPDGQFEVRGGSYLMRCEIWGLTYAFRRPPPGFHAPDVGFRVVAV